MTTQPTVNDIPAIVDDEASRRAAEVAAAAAGQIDQATKDAEAIARAAESTHLGARLQSLEEGNAAWRASMETKLTEEAAARAAQAEALKASILEAISTQQSTPPVVVDPPVVASVSEEPKPNSKPMDTTQEPTPKPSPSPAQRLRRVL